MNHKKKRKKKKKKCDDPGRGRQQVNRREEEVEPLRERSTLLGKEMNKKTVSLLREYLTPIRPGITFQESPQFMASIKAV